MSATVTDINRERMERGQDVFLVCPECKCGISWAMQGVRGKDGDTISLLLCVSDTCNGNGAPYTVINGVIQYATEI